MERNVLPLPEIEHRFSGWRHWALEVTLEGATCLLEERNGSKGPNLDDDDDDD
jgi:hypothetical protein